MSELASSGPDSAAADEERFHLEDATRFVTQLLGGLGLPIRDASVVADALLDADACRIRTHGLRLLPSYVGRLLAGAMNPVPDVRVVRERGAVTTIDGDDGFGQVVGRRALDHTLGAVREHGLAITFVRGSNHLGALGYFARLAAEAGTFAFVGQNTRDNMVLPGGRRPAIGNNPFALAMPSGRPDPVVLDVSCSRVARNTLYRAAERGEPIPEGVAVDENGDPTTDPVAAIRGAALPFGGHKGAGLALFVGALAGVLSGAKIGPEVPAPDDYERDRGLGHVLLLMDLDAVDERRTYEERMRRYLDDIRASGEGLRYPGERRARSREDAVRRGVSLPRYVIDALVVTAREAGTDVEPPQPIGAN